jgi:hypothetical protein
MYADYGLDTNAVRLQKVVEGQQLVMKRVVTKSMRIAVRHAGCNSLATSTQPSNPQKYNYN